jgi:hypothetical protein
MGTRCSTIGLRRRPRKVLALTVIAIQFGQKKMFALRISTLQIFSPSHLTPDALRTTSMGGDIQAVEKLISEYCSRVGRSGNEDDRTR